MYDAEIIIPITSKSIKRRPQYYLPLALCDYKKRFLDFKKYGLLNTKNHKIIVKLLTCNDNFSNLELLEGWPEGVTAKKIECPSTHPAAKIAHYYGNLTSWRHANWFMKLDDDSCTDIAGLMKNLETYFNPEKEYFIASELHKNNTDIEQELLKSLGHNWILGASHEWELSIISKIAIKTITDNSSAREFLTRRSKIDKGFGDCLLNFAARMSKIYPCDVGFISHLPKIGDFSLFGGIYNHIHFVSYDYNGNYQNYLAKSVENRICPPDIWEKLENKNYMFLRNGSEFIGYFKFSLDGRLIGSMNPNESLWDFEDNSINFYNKEIKLTTKFSHDEEFNIMNGVFLLDPYVNHKIINILNLD